MQLSHRCATANPFSILKNNSMTNDNKSNRIRIDFITFSGLNRQFCVFGFSNFTIAQFISNNFLFFLYRAFPVSKIKSLLCVSEIWFCFWQFFFSLQVSPLPLEIWQCETTTASERAQCIGELQWKCVFSKKVTVNVKHN